MGNRLITIILTFVAISAMGQGSGVVLQGGVQDGWAKVNIPEGYKDNTLKVPMINMRKSIIKTIGLDEVVVKATRIKLSLSRVKPITFMAVSGKR